MTCCTQFSVLLMINNLRHPRYMSSSSSPSALPFFHQLSTGDKVLILEESDASGNSDWCRVQLLAGPPVLNSSPSSVSPVSGYVPRTYLYNFSNQALAHPGNEKEPSFIPNQSFPQPIMPIPPMAAKRSPFKNVRGPPTCTVA